MLTDEQINDLEDLYDAMKYPKNDLEALIYAAIDGQTATVRELLKVAEVLEYIKANHNLVLRYAVAEGHTEILRELLKIDEVRNNAAAGHNYLLRFAVAKGHTEILRELLKIYEVRNNAAAYDNYLLRFAAKDGRTETVRELLKIDEVRNNVTALNNEALRMAAFFGHTETVRELLKIDAVRKNASAFNNEALIFAAGHGYIEIVKELLKIDAVRNNFTALYMALISAADAGDGHAEIVGELLKVDDVLFKLENLDAFHMKILYEIAKAHEQRKIRYLPEYVPSQNKIHEAYAIKSRLRLQFRKFNHMSHRYMFNKLYNDLPSDLLHRVGEFLIGCSPGNINTNAMLFMFYASRTGYPANIVKDAIEEAECKEADIDKGKLILNTRHIRFGINFV